MVLSQGTTHVHHEKLRMCTIKCHGGISVAFGSSARGAHVIVCRPAAQEDHHFAVSAEAGLAAPCADRAAIELFTVSLIVLANFFIPGMLALIASDKPVLQFWK